MNKRVLFYITKMEEALRSMGYSKNTVRTYKSAIIDYYKNCSCSSECSCDPCSCNIRDIERYLQNKKNEGKSPRTLNLYINVFRFFFVKITQSIKDFSLKFEKVKLVKKLNIVSEDDLKKILSSMADKYKIAVYLAYNLGLTVSEIVNLKCSDLNLRRSSLYVRDSSGNINRILYLPDDILVLLGRFVSGRNINEYLIQGKDKNKISERSIQKEFKKQVEKNDLGNITFSSLRDSFIYNLKQNGASEDDFMKILGFKNKRTVKRYVFSN